MIEDILKILERGYLCDPCLGRFFYDIIPASSNRERGVFVRSLLIGMNEKKPLENLSPSNFHTDGKERCFLCGGIFDEIDDYCKKAVKKLKAIEFNSFLVGCLVPDEVLGTEEDLWEITGIKYVESIKFDLNRELRKKVLELTKKPINFNSPDVIILFDFNKKDIEIKINSLYILGYYNKLKRGIPQCKWGTPEKYVSSVQELVAKPLLKVTKSRDTSFHGYGREDVDARCFGFRPFVIEMIDPKVRKFNIKEMQRKINKSTKINVKLVKMVDKTVVRRIKTEMGDKTYRVDVIFEKPVDRRQLKRLKGLIGVIDQRTPVRVSHRRADLTRRRIVKELKYKVLGPKKIELIVKTNAGLYVKELVHGDEGRTSPSVSGILGIKAVPKNLDVIKIDGPKNL